MTTIREADCLHLANNGWLFFRSEAAGIRDLFLDVIHAEQVFSIKISLHRKDNLNIVIIPEEGASPKSYAYSGNYTVQWRTT